MLDYPQVVLDFMNRDHAEFVALRGELLDLLTQNSPVAEVDTLLEKLLEHTRLHFAEEERLMLETQFPPYPVHKGEHEKVLANMADHFENWKAKRDAAALRKWLETPVADWFVAHVGTMDHVTAGFIKMNQ
ncbi:MAG: hemerythrin family protein [Sideroxydans sp.]|nr:hemerythrin family protein [Sideroxydans sp.]